ncbi:hypothetical protein AAGW05_06185 [Arthrobacter sp. LAPM80]|uniref:hypothetical protein n=1 Tax=Arthrobacter sp. LAPM80 TaxID=3141788 RepID=UPI00398BA163
MTADEGTAAAPHSIGSKPKLAKKSVGTAVAAVTLAAVTVLSGPGLVAGSASSLDAAGIIRTPTNSAATRIAGVHEDLVRAVELQQVTPEQAAFLERQLVKRIQGEV